MSNRIPLSRRDGAARASTTVASAITTSIAMAALLSAPLWMAGCGGATAPAARQVAPTPAASPRPAGKPATPTAQSTRRCTSEDGGVFQGTRLQLRVCRVTAKGRPAMRRTVRFYNSAGRRIGQASTSAKPWPTTRPLPKAGVVLEGPDPLWLLPNGFAAINISSRRVELLFEADGDRRLVAAVQRGQRVGFVTFGRHGCPAPLRSEAGKPGQTAVRAAPRPCLAWMVVDFGQGALLLRQTVPAARAVGLGFGRHEGKAAAWLRVDGADGEHTWVAHLAPRPLSAKPTVKLPKRLSANPSQPAAARRRWWVHP